MEKRERPSWDEYFVDLVLDTAERSSCLNRHVGALAVRENRQLATGYNGAPHGLVSCYDANVCWRREQGIEHGKDKDLCLAVHAEANTIAQAADMGVSLRDATMYVTTFPCPTCAKLMIQSRIKEVRYIHDYYGKQHDFAAYLLKEAKIGTIKLKLDKKKLSRKHPNLKLVSDRETKK